MAVQPRKKALGVTSSSTWRQKHGRTFQHETHFNTNKVTRKELTDLLLLVLCGHEFSRYQFVVGNATISL